MLHVHHRDILESYSTAHTTLVSCANMAIRLDLMTGKPHPSRCDRNVQHRALYQHLMLYQRMEGGENSSENFTPPAAPLNNSEETSSVHRDCEHLTPRTREIVKEHDDPEETTEECNGRLMQVLSQMMFVSGEQAEPSAETTYLIEEIVREQVIEMVSTIIL